MAAANRWATLARLLGTTQIRRLTMASGGRRGPRALLWSRTFAASVCYRRRGVTINRRAIAIIRRIRAAHSERTLYVVAHCLRPVANSRDLDGSRQVIILDFLPRCFDWPEFIHKVVQRILCLVQQYIKETVFLDILGSARLPR